MIGPTHAHGGTLDLLMTEVRDLVRVAVVAPLGRSYHSSLSIAISISPAIPTLCVSRRVLLKHRVNWTAVCDAIGVLPWRCIWSADNPVERLNVHLSLLVEKFVPALELTGICLSITRGGPMLYKPRLCISLVSEAGCADERPVSP